MREFAVEFSVRKGLGPDTTVKTVFVGLDDLPPEVSEPEIKAMAEHEARHELEGKGLTVFGLRGIYES